MPEAVITKKIYLGGTPNGDVVLEAVKGQPIPADILADYKTKLEEVGILAAASEGKKKRPAPSAGKSGPTTNTRG